MLEPIRKLGQSDQRLKKAGQKRLMTWANAPLIVYHGTDEFSVPSIADGINLAVCRPFTDLGWASMSHRVSTGQRGALASQ